jgi:hypothetical protein
MILALLDKVDTATYPEDNKNWIRIERWKSKEETAH